MTREKNELKVVVLQVGTSNRIPSLIARVVGKVEE